MQSLGGQIRCIMEDVQVAYWKLISFLRPANETWRCRSDKMVLDRPFSEQFLCVLINWKHGPGTTGPWGCSSTKFYKGGSASRSNFFHGQNPVILALVTEIWYCGPNVAPRDLFLGWVKRPAGDEVAVHYHCRFFTDGGDHTWSLASL